MTTTAIRAHCRATKANGAPCGSFATASGYCFIHDPASAAQVADARRKGGSARHGRKVGPVGDAEPIHLNDMESVLDLLETCANDALSLENSLGRVRAVTGVCLAWAKVFETSELERRLAALESRLANGNG